MPKMRLIEARDLPLESWLSRIFVERHKRDYLIEDSHFASDDHRDQFLDSIRLRSEQDVRRVLRLFLMTSGTLGADYATRETLKRRPTEQLLELMDECEFVRRMFEPPFRPWEGITWVLDLLPEHPSQALAALDAYFRAHGQFLSDGRLHGMSDAEAIIRTRYLHWANPREALLVLSPEEFEYLIASLYRGLGYEVWVTKKSGDGGVDVEATRTQPGARESAVIQCKRYVNTVGVSAVRELRGVVAQRQANKGVVIATGGFTRAARVFAAQNGMIELLDFGDLNILLNRVFGPKWPNSISYRVREEQTDAIRRAATGGGIMGGTAAGSG